MIICKKFDARDPIYTIEDWKEKCPPAKIEHWKDGRSAKELAKDWTKNRGKDLEIIIGSYPEFKGIRFIKASPEYESRFDSYGKGRHHDLLVLASDIKGQVLVSVEAKADESFGPLMKDVYLKKITNRLKGIPTHAPNRIEDLMKWIFSENLTPKIFDYRYQLLHGVAGIIAESKKREINRAIFVINVYKSDNKDIFSPEDNSNNIKDLELFISHLSKGKVNKIGEEELYRIISIDDIDLYLIKREIKI
jgi:hypothetical protein